MMDVKDFDGVRGYAIENDVRITAEWYGAHVAAGHDLTGALRPSCDPRNDTLDTLAHGRCDRGVVTSEPIQNVIDVLEGGVCIDDLH
jgi:hypothetical protein